MSTYNALSGIDRLRLTVEMLNGCNESFCQRYSASELLQIARVHFAQVDPDINPLGIDCYPDEWSPQQIRYAIDFSEIPQWYIEANGELTPNYTRKVFVK